MDKKKASYQEGTVSIIVNTGLFFIKYWAGIVSGSVALIADAWQTLSDSISSLIVIAGANLSSRGLIGSKSIRESYRIAKAIERNIYDELCISTTIHVDPDILETCGGD